MRKLIWPALLLTLVMLVAACGQTPAAESASGLPAAEETAAAAETASAETAAPSQTEAAEPAVEETSVGSSDLIVYFSWSGNTRQVAEAIQKQTGADVFEIVPAVPYPADYDETVDVGREEQRAGARPEIAGELADLDSYDRIFIGFPNWWGDMPMILYTFFDTYDLSGKTLAPFVTSASSGFSGTRSTMAELEPDVVLTDGLDIKERNLDSTDQSVADWLGQIQG